MLPETVPPREVVRNRKFMKQIAAYSLLCAGRFLFPHPGIETALSSKFYGAVILYFLLTLALVFSYELIHDAFSSSMDEFSRATPKERWGIRLSISAYFSFLLATPKEEKLTLLAAWGFGTVLAYLTTKVNLRGFEQK
ncbi:hypothetical protein E3E36_07030 [Thermococcus sp. M36]|uniref:hypothetical protein n=1 Tax=Thermococcus sp. M36 TaxID=1638261 RepID=UPI00143C0D56|nr:hypothetical protein [Thermococcus sp. M36]NJE05900.1 hypothetical protein [Thermococcus sp. M36]